MSAKKSFDSEWAHEKGFISDSREIFLHSDYEGAEDTGIDYRGANKFLISLRCLESMGDEPIIVHQSTFGGDWYYGMMIYDAIKQSKCKFVFVSHGICASMGSIIAQAAKGKGVRVTMPNCGWIIHEGTTEISCTYRQMFSHYDFAKTILDKMYSVYAEAIFDSKDYFKGMSKEKIKRFIKRKLTSKEDWYMDASDAVFYGFADGIMGRKGFESLEKIVKDVS